MAGHGDVTGEGKEGEGEERRAQVAWRSKGVGEVNVERGCMRMGLGPAPPACSIACVSSCWGREPRRREKKRKRRKGRDKENEKKKWIFFSKTWKFSGRKIKDSLWGWSKTYFC
jgi:hypothetical protein